MSKINMIRKLSKTETKYVAGGLAWVAPVAAAVGRAVGRAVITGVVSGAVRGCIDKTTKKKNSPK